MKRKPWIIIVLAWLHILAPIGNLVTNAYWAHIPFFRYVELYFDPNHFHKHIYSFSIPILSGICIFVCRRWSLVLYFFLMIALLVLNIRGYNERMMGLTPVALAAVTFFNIAITAYFLIPRVRTVYFDARVRWWETKPRYHCDRPVKLATSAGVVSATVKNFSETGILVLTEKPITMGETVQVKFDMDGGSVIFPAQTVRQDHLTANCFGLQFRHNWGSRQEAKKLARTFREKGMAINQRVPGPEDHFLTWLKKVFRSGKGLVP